ncbi:hypothetical protein [Streptomyces sp. CB03578]|nr:hypothetical protein [Streptomyces sp. CB03578]
MTGSVPSRAPRPRAFFAPLASTLLTPSLAAVAFFFVGPSPMA